MRLRQNYISFFFIGVVVLLLKTKELHKRVCQVLYISNGDAPLPEMVHASSQQENDALVCTSNPYKGAFDEKLEVISDRMSTWLDRVNQYVNKSGSDTMSLWNHDRFYVFDEMSTCGDTDCIGGPCLDDTSKIVCGLSELNRTAAGAALRSKKKNNDTCVVYSIGGNNNWDFERDLLKKTPCEVHTFDCTGDISRFQVPDYDRLTFHHICIGAKAQAVDATNVFDDKGTCIGRSKCGETMSLLGMQQMLGHTGIDLLKMDVEGFEWGLFQSWPVLSSPVARTFQLPMQILIEVHYRTNFPELLRPGITRRHDFKSPLDVVNLQVHLLRMGYAVIKRDDNKACRHCTELTLIRVKCHDKKI